ncbi:MAG: 6-phosphogluconolactonase [bacterium]
MNISRTTKEKLAFEFNTILIKTIDKVMSSGKYKRFAIFLSGGSIKSVYSSPTLQAYFSKNKSLVDLFVMDERYTNEISEDALNDIGIRNSEIINFANSYTPIIDSSNLIELLPSDKYVKDYSDKLNVVFMDKDIYKIGLMGIGGDYHTAGISPNSDKELFNSFFCSKELVSYHEFGKPPFNKRITTTITGLNSFNEFFVFLKGYDKKQVIEYLLGNELYDLNLRPCGIYKSMKTTLVTDITSS